MTVKASKTQKEVTASYSIDDASLDLTFKFPTNYPLRQIEIDTGLGKVVGVPESKWRAWILSMTVLLISQNGSIYDAVSIFQKTVSLHFQGVEDCAICKSFSSLQAIPLSESLTILYHQNNVRTANINSILLVYLNGLKLQIKVPALSVVKQVSKRNKKGYKSLSAASLRSTTSIAYPLCSNNFLARLNNLS